MKSKSLTELKIARACSGLDFFGFSLELKKKLGARSTQILPIATAPCIRAQLGSRKDKEPSHQEDGSAKSKLTFDWPTKPWATEEQVPALVVLRTAPVVARRGTPPCRCCAS